MECERYFVYSVRGVNENEWFCSDIICKWFNSIKWKVRGNFKCRVYFVLIWKK